MKKIFACVILFALISAIGIALSFAVSAADVVSLTVDDEPVYAEYQPIWDETRTRILVLSDFFSKYFDAQVNVTESTVTILQNGHSLLFNVGESQFTMDNIGGRNLSAPIEKQNGLIYLPVRFVCEAMNAMVEWNQENHSVSIKKGSLTLQDDIKPYFEGITVFDQSTIRFSGDTVIYVDPYTISGEPHDADVILVTHTHNDHFNIDSIKKIIKDTTILLVTADGVDKAKENGFENVIAVVPNENYTPGGINVRTIPAYNISKQNHKKENNFVGYIVTYNDKTYYAAGDTDYIPEMNDLNVDVAFLPIDGRFNMEETEAAAAANAIAPKIAVPYHYNNFSAEANAKAFTELLNEGISGAVMTFKMYE